MSAVSDSPRPAGASKECFVKRIDDALRQSDLLVQRHNDVLARDWGQFAKNYADGYGVLYVKVEAAILDGEHRPFTFLVTKKGLVCGIANQSARDSSRASSAADSQVDPTSQARDHANKTFPVLVGVGDFVDGPQGIVPSWVWLLGCDQRPLIGREFLFYSILHPLGWKRLSLPSRQPAEWEPYARAASPVLIDKLDHQLVEGAPQMPDGFDDLPREVIRRVALQAGDYMGPILASGDVETVRPALGVKACTRLDVVELAFSTFDLFV
jgi:hypothetical protein